VAVLNDQPAAGLEDFILVLQDVSLSALHVQLDEVRQDGVVETPEMQ